MLEQGREENPYSYLDEKMFPEADDGKSEEPYAVVLDEVSEHRDRSHYIWLAAFLLVAVVGIWALTVLGSGEEKLEHPAFGLIGEKAPPVELRLMEGGTVNLSDLAGEKIIVLDFWGAWCAPSTEGLPRVSAVTSSFADKDVVFYAVNVSDGPAKINDFLKRQNLDLPVVLDSSGKVAGPFQVSSIPQTVVIDRSGNVRTVYVGYSPELGSNLRKVLEHFVEEGKRE